MPDTNEWRPKVGERVAIYGEITNFVAGDEIIAVRHRDSVVRWVDVVNVSPLSVPIAREPWEVLREAADIMAANSWLNAPEQLRRQADRLEAAARPAPTLAEAVRAYSEKLNSGASEVGAEYAAMMEALARGGRAMSAVDTPEAVEEMAAGCDYYAAGEAAAMLRRLHARAVEAEEQRDHWKWQAEHTRGHAEKAEAALATARADALRKAADVCLARMRPDSAHEAPYNAEDLACSKAILALIPEKPHAE